MMVVVMCMRLLACCGLGGVAPTGPYGQVRGWRQPDARCASMTLTPVHRFCIMLTVVAIVE